MWSMTVPRPRGRWAGILWLFFYSNLLYFLTLMLRGDPPSAVLWGWGWFWSCQGTFGGSLCEGRAVVGRLSRPRVRGSLEFLQRFCSVAGPVSAPTSTAGLLSQPGVKGPGAGVCGPGTSCPSRPILRGASTPPDATPCHQLPPSCPQGERPVR